MSAQNLDYVAAAKVTAQVGPVFTLNRGFSGVVRNGAGDYSLTLDRDIDATQRIVDVRNTTAVIATRNTAFSVVNTSDSVIQVLCLQETGGGGGGASAQTDVNFSITVRKVY